MVSYHRIERVLIEEAGILSMAVDGTPLRVDLRALSPRLAGASLSELSLCEVSPSGYGLHWPLLDEDISVDGLLGVVHRPMLMPKSA